MSNSFSWNFYIIITLLGVYQLIPGLMALALFQGHRYVRIINCKFLFRFLSTSLMVHVYYKHWKDQEQYALCDWCVFTSHNWHDLCNFSRERESSERLLLFDVDLCVRARARARTRARNEIQKNRYNFSQIFRLWKRGHIIEDFFLNTCVTGKELESKSETNCRQFSCFLFLFVSAIDRFSLLSLSSFSEGGKIMLKLTFR